MPWGLVATLLTISAPFSRGSGSNPADVVLGLLFRNLGGGEGDGGSSEGKEDEVASEKAWLWDKPDAAAMADNKPTAYGFVIGVWWGFFVGLRFSGRSGKGFSGSRVDCGMMLRVCLVEKRSWEERNKWERLWKERKIIENRVFDILFGIKGRKEKWKRKKCFILLQRHKCP